MKIDTTILEHLIVGRVEPHIYAFSTETVPNYLKVGDTARSVRVRLDEWRKIFPNLIKRYEHSAQIDADTIFRDFAVHGFLEREKGRTRLQPDTFKQLPYYSREFFKDATPADLDEAIADIHQSARERNGKYTFYSPSGLQQTWKYERTENYPPRQNQQQVIDNFKAAINAGRTNLLLYAVMRFGKSFTAMCCAKEMNAKMVVIVSAKADVGEEWKKTVESHVYFADYMFLDSKALQNQETVVADTLAAGNRVALFLTLQDLQGDAIKAKHQEVFEHQADLLIIDETHFGARGAVYGKVLQQQNLSPRQIKNELRNVDGFETLDQVDEAVKTLHATVRLHLSGTPYRILMGGEFQKEDIIAFVQFTDIIEAQQQWDDEHLQKDDCNEWDNPYYGFPQMIRFAFNPNASSMKKMDELRKAGITHAFSELFRPRSMTVQAGGGHRQFVHEAEILDLLEVIDGTKADENLLGFLDDNKIKQGKMCRHIVVVLPFRASCDSMAALIEKNRQRFKNLGEYELINIAGFDGECRYKTTEDVKCAIANCETRQGKTLTLTVNRMLTGTTVPQWDTMLYLKGTASPQEYDQAIFRLQNQYVTTYQDEDSRIIRYNMKPQTLLVDFDPNRMFRLQELKSQIYNVNTQARGNTDLRERIAKELKVSPIIVLNKNKLQEVTPSNIIDAVRDYSRNRSILDDASDIPADYTLLDNAEILSVIQDIAPIDSKSGLHIKPAEGTGEDFDMPDVPAGDEDAGAGQPADGPEPTRNRAPEAEADEKLAKRLAAYYARVLFFAFLTDSVVKSLKEVIAAIPATADNRRIARNVGLDPRLLMVIQQKSLPNVLGLLDCKIENTNDLIRDAALQPLERVAVAMRKFGRLSDSEIVTPEKVADEMVAVLPFDELKAKPGIKALDIASKQGEFAMALYRRFGDVVKTGLYAIPTSALAYEFTRKVYSLLGMPVEHVFSGFTSYDWIGEKGNWITQQLAEMKFDVVIGNPPYTVNVGKIKDNYGIPLYDKFVEMSKQISPSYISMIIPSRWMTGGRGLGEFRKRMLADTHIKYMKDFATSRDCFDNVDIPGGVSYFLWDAKFQGYCEFVRVAMGKTFSRKRDLNQYTMFLRENELLTIIEKVNKISKSNISGWISSQTPFGFTTTYRGKSERFSHALSLHTSRGVSYVALEEVTRNKEWIPLYKVIFSKATCEHAGQPDKNGRYRILSFSAILGPNEVCSQSYLVGGVFVDERQAANYLSYLKTRFVRALIFPTIASQDLSHERFMFVPMQDFTSDSDINWSKSIAEIDAQLYVKYGLTDEEIAFIESIIRPME